MCHPLIVCVVTVAVFKTKNFCFLLIWTGDCASMFVALNNEDYLLMRAMLIKIITDVENASYVLWYLFYCTFLVYFCREVSHI